jgi:thymidylate synthase (FAD)
MQVVKPSAEVFFHMPQVLGGIAGEAPHPKMMELIEPPLFLELVGRSCYKSEDKITEGSAGKFIKMLRDRGHHAMLEHCVASARFVCDRGVSHELVRHRLAAWAQESTRYCNYTKGRFGGQIAVIDPPEACITTDKVKPDELLGRRYTLFQLIEEQYQWEIERGILPQIARGVLPTCLKTEIWITANLREWMHIFSLRMDGATGAPHPQMKELMELIRPIFAKHIPELFAPPVAVE